MTDHDELPKIDQSYLLVIPIPFYVAADQSTWLDRLWHRDFAEHFRYLSQLTLAAPCHPKADQPDLVRVDPPRGVKFRCAPLPRQDSRMGALLRLPLMFIRLWNAIGKADIVHSGIGGWPYPIGWIANAVAMMRRKTRVIVVESAGWRLTGSESDRWKRRRARITESLGRWCVNHAHLTIATQPSYLDSLLTRNGGRGAVIPASWIHEGDILSDDAAHALWDQKRPRAPEGIRFLFAGQLTPDKGIEVLLEAIRRLDSAGVGFKLDIVGRGELRDRCLQASKSHRFVEISVLDPVPYGARFFALIRSYHGLVVPSLADEQPRIIYDGYSQAVPLLAANTDGIRPYVEEGRTGWLVRPNDPAALADGIRQMISQSSELRAMGLNGLEAARKMTSREMHRRRWRLLRELLEES